MNRVLYPASILACAAFALLSGPTLAQGDPEAGKQKAAVCAACHGADGNAVKGAPEGQAYPDLAGQTARYLYLQLRDFKEGRRKNPLMSPMAANLSKQDMYDLAEYFSKQKHAPSTYKTDPAKVAEGKKVADAALCTMCHLGGFSGQNEVPRVAGQEYDYIVKQLKDFRARERTNDAGNMTSVSRGLTDEQIDALANYITSLE
ncbi:MAG TPA: c-type cytochrome [Burkholderiales bacterium]|nr:c-type cytochrome [Burkholderiales bacterium]